MNFKFELGDILKEKITGFTGVVMVRAEYFTGCVHYGLCAQKIDKDGKIPDWQWIDATRLVKLEGKVELDLPKGPSAISGPMPSGPSAGGRLNA